MDKIISDRGLQFAAKSFLELLKLLKIKSSLTTAYHPESDGVLWLRKNGKPLLDSQDQSLVLITLKEQFNRS